jgi:hypothetical protein
MKKAIVVLLGLLLCSGTLLSGQENKQPKAKLVRTPFAGGDVMHVIQEAALDLKEYANGSGDMVAIRLCSKEPMPVALSTAAASPFIMLEYLDHYGFSRERILLLRSEDCLGDNPAIAVTEFWAIPKGAGRPQSVESIKSNQARLEVVRTEDTIKSAKGYRVSLRQLIAKLRVKPEAVGVVVGSYNENPSPTLKKNLHVARRVLEQSRLSGGRYFVRLTPPSGMRSDDPSEPEPKYPSLFVVEVAKARDSARR